MVYLPGMRIRVQIPKFHIELSGYDNLPEIPGTKLACQIKQCTEFPFQQETLFQYIMDGTLNMSVNMHTHPSLRYTHTMPKSKIIKKKL